MRFFCCIPLKTITGAVFGTLELFDPKPRLMTQDEEIRFLKFGAKILKSLRPFSGWPQPGAQSESRASSPISREEIEDASMALEQLATEANHPDLNQLRLSRRSVFSTHRPIDYNAQPLIPSSLEAIAVEDVEVEDETYFDPDETLKPSIPQSKTQHFAAAIEATRRNRDMKSGKFMPDNLPTSSQAKENPSGRKTPVQTGQKVDLRKAAEEAKHYQDEFIKNHRRKLDEQDVPIIPKTSPKSSSKSSSQAQDQWPARVKPSKKKSEAQKKWASHQLSREDLFQKELRQAEEQAATMDEVRNKTQPQFMKASVEDYSEDYAYIPDLQAPPRNIFAKYEDGSGVRGGPSPAQLGRPSPAQPGRPSPDQLGRSFKQKGASTVTFALPPLELPPMDLPPRSRPTTPNDGRPYSPYFIQQPLNLNNPDRNFNADARRAKAGLPHSSTMKKIPTSFLGKITNFMGKTKAEKTRIKAEKEANRPRTPAEQEESFYRDREENKARQDAARARQLAMDRANAVQNAEAQLRGMERRAAFGSDDEEGLSSREDLANARRRHAELQARNARQDAEMEARREAERMEAASQGGYARRGPYDGFVDY